MGIRLETDADLNAAIHDLERAKGAWQSHDPSLRLHERALAWDGTSEVNPFERLPVSGATFSVVAMDSSGTVLAPETFVTREDGSPDWFVIPRRKGQPAMPVRLLVGSDVGEHRGYGLTHILASRGFSFWKDRSPERYISSILANVSELYEVAPGRELLVKGRQPSSWMLLQLNRKDGFYSIVSAYPVRQGKKPLGKKLPLAERQPANANSGTARLGPGSASKAALPSQSAGGGDGFSLPQGAHVVNVNEVECRFDDGAIVPVTFSLSLEKEAIKKEAVAAGTFMKAPNGADTNLKEDQWLTVRTKAFKRWFGDWEKVARLSFDSNTVSIALAEEYLRALKGREISNEETGICVSINSNQRKELLNASKARRSHENGFSYQGHYAVVSRIDEVFKNAVYCGVYEDKKHEDSSLHIHRFACPIVMDGESGVAWMTVKEALDKKNGKRLYNLELIKIEKLAGNLGSIERHSLHAFPSASGDIVTRVEEACKSLVKDCSKVVDENGEPMVVYHGTTAPGFTAFDSSVVPWAEPVDNKFYFSNDKRTALLYAGFVDKEADLNQGDILEETGAIYSAFLNLRNPKEVSFDDATYSHEIYGVKSKDGKEYWEDENGRVFYTDGDATNWAKENGIEFDPDEDLSTTTRSTDEEAMKAMAEGYDGLIIREVVDAMNEDYTEYITADDYIVFSPTAIKSATQNRGTFDASNADITFSVVARDGRGKALTAETFVTRLDGSVDWFVMPKRKGQPAMPVRLLVGEDISRHKGYGLTHIAASRNLDGLWGKTTPERFLSSILANVSELWEISPGRELLVKGKKPSAWMVLQLARKEGYYSIVTAHPVAGSKKPNGKRLPLAERIAGKNQTRVDRSQRPANPDAVPDAFPGGQESEPATLASTAGGGDVSSLPPGARVVNINDVRLRFDDGRQMQAGSPVSTMSLALMDDGLDSAPHLKERVIQQLIGDVRTAVRRFNRVFAGNTGVEAAVREMGQAQALLGMMNKYAAKGYRPRLTAQMRYVEVYARMLESGKILAYGKLNAQELESLKEDLETELSDAVDVSARGVAWEAAEGGLYGKHELERLETQARQEVRDTLVRDYAGRKLDEVVRDMLNQGAAQLEKQLKDEEMARIGKLLDFIRPRKDPKTGKLKKGLMNAEGYREVMRVVSMMSASKGVVDYVLAGLRDVVDRGEADNDARDRVVSVLKSAVVGMNVGQGEQTWLVERIDRVFGQGELNADWLDEVDNEMKQLIHGNNLDNCISGVAKVEIGVMLLLVIRDLNTGFYYILRNILLLQQPRKIVHWKNIYRVIQKGKTLLSLSGFLIRNEYCKRYIAL